MLPHTSGMPVSNEMVVEHPAAQEAFFVEYGELKRNEGEIDVIFFMDAAQPQHNPVLGGVWIERCQNPEVNSNTGRRRVNISGAVDLERLGRVVRFDETVDGDSIVALFEPLEQANLHAARIYVVCDNARYYRSTAVQEYLKILRVRLVFLPPYAQNLNLIERLWGFFKKHVLYDRFDVTFPGFKAARADFFLRPLRRRQELRS